MYVFFFSLQGMMGNITVAGSFGTNLDTQCSITLPQSGLTDSGSIESNVGELPVLPHSLTDSHSNSPMPTVWPASYPGVSSLLMGHGKSQGLTSQGVGKNADMLRTACMEDGKFPQMDRLASSSVHLKMVYFFT